MPPKAVAATGKDENAKRAKDLEFLFICLKTCPNVVQVDYEELLKELVKQGYDINIGAARTRVSRMGKALGITTKTAMGATSGGDVTPNAKTPVKKKAAGRKKATKSSGDDDDDDDQEAAESPLKKQKLEGDIGNAKDNEQEYGRVLYLHD